MIIDIVAAVRELGHECAFHGDLPTSVDQITDEYLTQTVDAGFDLVPRLQMLDNGSLTAAQIKTKIQELLGISNIAEIKRKANDAIVSEFPEWKQRNFIARSTELTMKVANGGTLTAEEQQEVDGMTAVWAWVKSVRATSDQAEIDETPSDDIVFPSAP